MSDFGLNISLQTLNKYAKISIQVYWIDFVYFNTFNEIISVWRGPKSFATGYFAKHDTTGKWRCRPSIIRINLIIFIELWGFLRPQRLLKGLFFTKKHFCKFYCIFFCFCYVTKMCLKIGCFSLLYETIELKYLRKSWMTNQLFKCNNFPINS